MFEQYPCMKIDCNKVAEYGIEAKDGNGTTVCEEHLEEVKALSWYLSHYRLDEMEE